MGKKVALLTCSRVKKMKCVFIKSMLCVYVIVSWVLSNAKKDSADEEIAKYDGEFSYASQSSRREYC